jgi:hypothetical protein
MVELYRPHLPDCKVGRKLSRQLYRGLKQPVCHLTAPLSDGENAQPLEPTEGCFDDDDDGFLKRLRKTPSQEDEQAERKRKRDETDYEVMSDDDFLTHSKSL